MLTHQARRLDCLRRSALDQPAFHPAPKSAKTMVDLRAHCCDDEILERLVRAQHLRNLRQQGGFNRNGGDLDERLLRFLVSHDRHAHSYANADDCAALPAAIRSTAMDEPDDPTDADFECAAVYLLTATGECYRCERPTPMHALMVLPPFRLVGVAAGAEGDEDDLDENECMLREIGAMPVQLASRIQARTAGTWRQDHSQTARSSYWMNHCHACGAKQGDFFVHGANGPFWPNTEAEMDAIEAERIEGPFVFQDAGFAYSGAMIDWRDRKHGVAPEPVVVKRRPARKKAP